MSEPKCRSANRGVAVAAWFVSSVISIVSTAEVAAQATQKPPGSASRAPTADAAPVPSNTFTLSFSEDFKTPTSYKERFDYGWSGEWNAGSMFGVNRNDWHADHGMMCENPNSSHRTIHVTSQEQARDAAVYYCMPGGNEDKGHMMTTVNTEGYVTVWFSPKQIFRNVSKVWVTVAPPIEETWSPACQVIGFQPSIIRRPTAPVAQLKSKY